MFHLTHDTYQELVILGVVHSPPKWQMYHLTHDSYLELVIPGVGHSSPKWQMFHLTHDTYLELVIPGVGHSPPKWQMYHLTHGSYLELVIPRVGHSPPKWQMYYNLAASVDDFFQPATRWKERVEIVELYWMQQVGHASRHVDTVTILRMQSKQNKPIFNRELNTALMNKV